MLDNFENNIVSSEYINASDQMVLDLDKMENTDQVEDVKVVSCTDQNSIRPDHSLSMTIIESQSLNYGQPSGLDGSENRPNDHLLQIMDDLSESEHFSNVLGQNPQQLHQLDIGPTPSSGSSKPPEGNNIQDFVKPLQNDSSNETIISQNMLIYYDPQRNSRNASYVPQLTSLKIQSHNSNRKSKIEKKRPQIQPQDLLNSPNQPFQYSNQGSEPQNPNSQIHEHLLPRQAGFGPKKSNLDNFERNQDQIDQFWSNLKNYVILALCTIIVIIIAFIGFCYVNGSEKSAKMQTIVVKMPEMYNQTQLVPEKRDLPEVVTPKEIGPKVPKIEIPTPKLTDSANSEKSAEKVKNGKNSLKLQKMQKELKKYKNITKQEKQEISKLQEANSQLQSELNSSNAERVIEDQRIYDLEVKFRKLDQELVKSRKSQKVEKSENVRTVAEDEKPIAESEIDPAAKSENFEKQKSPEAPVKLPVATKTPIKDPKAAPVVVPSQGPPAPVEEVDTTVPVSPEAKTPESQKDDHQTPPPAADDLPASDTSAASSPAAVPDLDPMPSTTITTRCASSEGEMCLCPKSDFSMQTRKIIYSIGHDEYGEEVDFSEFDDMSPVGLYLEKRL